MAAGRPDSEGQLGNGHRPPTWHPAEHKNQLEAADDTASAGKTLAPQPMAVPALPSLHPAVENLPREGSGIRKAASNPGGDRGQPPWGLGGARGSMPTPAANGERADIPHKTTCLADRALPLIVKLHPKRNSQNLSPGNNVLSVIDQEFLFLAPEMASLAMK